MDKERPLRRVGGWLAFFVVTLCLNAAFAVLDVLAGVSGLDAPIPPFGPDWRSVMLFAMSVGAATAAGYLLMASFLIWRRRPGTPTLVIAFLWPTALLLPLIGSVGASVLLGGVWNDATGEFDPLTWPAVLSWSLLRLVYPAVLTAYLVRSKRVASTYRPADHARVASVFE